MSNSQKIVLSVIVLVLGGAVALMIFLAGASAANYYRLGETANEKETLAKPDTFIQVAGCEGVVFEVDSDGYLLMRCVDVTTPEPATPTPPPTIAPTVTITPTNTPTSTSRIDPYPSASPCSSHDDRAYHTLWNYDDGCHYDHSHGDDPHLVDDVFGTDVYYWFANDGNATTAEISYPWQTPNENLYKHGGYTWLVEKDLPCQSQFGTGCITDFRALVHAIGTSRGAVTANHSFWLEARVCPLDDPDNCGIFRGGGWQGPSRLAIDGGIVLEPEGSNEQRTFLHYFDTGNRCCGTWYTGWQTGAAGVVVEFGDMWDTVPFFMTAEEIVANSEWRCPVDDNTGEPLYGVCTNNSSDIQKHIVFVGIPGSLRPIVDPDGDGYADYFGYTDRNGNPMPTCPGIGENCVPVRWENVRVDIMHQFRGQYTDYDIYFDGEVSGWYRYQIDLTPTPSP